MGQGVRARWQKGLATALGALAATASLGLFGPAAQPAQALAFGEFYVFVWKVALPASGDAPEKVDHLVGTMHFRLASEEDVPVGLRILMRESTAFAMEVDPDGFNREAVRSRLRLAPGQDLRTMLSPWHFRKLMQQFAPTGLNPDQVATIKPWLFGLLGANAKAFEHVLDGYLRRQAIEAGKRMVYLESVEDQISALDGGTLPEKVEMLRRNLESPDLQDDALSALVEAYKDGELDAVRGLVFDDELLRRYPRYYEALFDKRNAKWLPQIERLFAQERAVTAVGLGHMLGPKGLIQMLKDKGYRVDPVPFR